MIDTKEYVRNLRKQPRPRVTADYGLKDLYKYYKDTTLKALIVPYNTFAAVIKDLSAEIMDKILLESKEVKFKSNLGYLRVKKRKMRFKNTENLRIDWAATKKVGKKVYHLNEHRDGYRYKFHWTKADSRVPNMSVYHFRPCRYNSRRLADILQNNKEIDYFE